MEESCQEEGWEVKEQAFVAYNRKLEQQRRNMLDQIFPNLLNSCYTFRCESWECTGYHQYPSATRAKSPSRAMAQPKKMRRAPPGGQEGGEGKKKRATFFRASGIKKSGARVSGVCDGHPPAALSV